MSYFTTHKFVLKNVSLNVNFQFIKWAQFPCSHYMISYIVLITAINFHNICIYSNNCFFFNNFYFLLFLKDFIFKKKFKAGCCIVSHIKIKFTKFAKTFLSKKML